MLKALSAARRVLDASAAAGKPPPPSPDRAAQLVADTAVLYRLLPECARTGSGGGDGGGRGARDGGGGGKGDGGGSDAASPPADDRAAPRMAHPHSATPAGGSQAEAEGREVPFEEQAAAVRAHLLAQATHLLTAVAEAAAPSAAFPHPQPLPLPRRWPPPPTPVDEAHSAVATEDAAEAEAAARVRSVLGWSLVKRRSTVGSGGDGGGGGGGGGGDGGHGGGGGGWDGGMGVVTAGRVPAGTMVAWYPGIAYGPGDVSAMPDYPNISAANSYLFTRYDSTILDAKPANAPTLARPIEEDEDGDLFTTGAPPATQSGNTSGGGCDATAGSPPSSLPETVTWERLNPLAVGHVINHPPPGTPPNVASFLLDLPMGRLPLAVAQLLPVVAHPPPQSLIARRLRAAVAAAAVRRVPGLEALLAGGTARASWMGNAATGVGEGAVAPAVAIVALRCLEDGEELWMDYRYRGGGGRPAWYTDVEGGGGRGRWAQGE
ncbi:hypothetical protein MMPV_008584 [Pyropia vietnamensis]